MLIVTNKPYMLTVVIPNAVMLSVTNKPSILTVIMPNAVMLSVVMPNVVAPPNRLHSLNEK